MKYTISFNDNHPTMTVPDKKIIGVVIRDEGIALSKSAHNWILIPWNRIKYLEVIDEESR